MSWRRKTPETYLPNLAATLNNLGTLDRDRNLTKEALKTFRELVQKDPQNYLPHVATTLNNLGSWITTRTRLRRPEVNIRRR